MVNYSYCMAEEFSLAALDRVLENIAFDTEFSIPELCKMLALSRTSLHRKITQSAGQSISLYVREFRLRKAYELLQSGELSVSDVAYEVGFSDLAYFSKCFKKVYGVAPSRLLNNED
ncbi:MAG: AraC family transcriptional regulator [Bacteroidota bacterium]